MTHKFRLALSSTLITLLLGGVLAPPAGADTVTDRATAWLVSKQQPDGGFEVAQFPPFETPDAILAIAENAQTTSTWSESAALAAVTSHDVNGAEPGGTPLDWADDYLAEPPTAGIAAKFIVLVAAPLGLPADAFDPAADGSPVDLVAAMDAGEDPESHSYGDGELNATLYALLAHAVLGRAAPADTLAYLRAAQQANGGWNFAGDPGGSDLDIDSTARAVTALVANGVPTGDATVAAAMKLLAEQQQASGAWLSFGADDTNSTAMAALAVASAGWRPSSACWRTSSSSAAAATGYVNPVAWLRSQQVTSGDPDDIGRFRSPNDAFGPEPNTSATTQAVQALLRSWLPVAPADAPRTEGFTDVPGCAWYTQGVAWMAANGISRSTTGTFHPKGSMSNGQLALLLWNTMDAPSGLPPHTFTDVPANAAYNDALDWMVAAGLVGDGGRFFPRREVSRARMAYLLWKTAGAPTATDLEVSDVSNGAYYADAVDWAVETGVITLLANGTFLPRNKLTRAQAANMAFRLASTAPAWGDVTLPSTIEFTP